MKVSTLVLTLIGVLDVACADSLRIENNSPARVLVWVDGEPIVSSSYTGKIGLNPFGVTKAKFQVVLDMVPDDFTFPHWDITVSVANKQIAAFSPALGNFKQAATESAVINDLNIARDRLKVLNPRDLSEIDRHIRVLLSNNKKAAGKRGLDVINADIREWWSDGEDMKLVTNVDIGNVEVIHGEIMALARVSEKSLKTGELKDRSILRFEGDKGEVNLVETIVFSKSAKSNDIMMLCNGQWVTFIDGDKK